MGQERIETATHHLNSKADKVQVWQRRTNESATGMHLGRRTGTTQRWIAAADVAITRSKWPV